MPPLNALRVFEVAARLGSFVAASEELHVTPAAVSHQVKTLEAHLGIALFQRLPRGLELTGAGKELLPNITRGLSHFARAIGALSGGELAGKLTISATPSLAALWLVPRLGDFMQAFPDIQIRLSAANQAPDLIKGEADLRIPYSGGEFPGLKSELLMRDTIFPVCAPSLLNHMPLRRFSDLRHHTLLQDFDVALDEPTTTWRRWMRDTGLQDTSPAGLVEFSNSLLLTEAAVRGQGVALGRMSLVRDHLETGRLVRPLKISRPGDYAYYTVTTEAGRNRPRVRVFLDWLDRQVTDESLDEAPV